MKYFLLFTFIVNVFLINAQEKIEVRMSELAIDSSMQPAFVADIPQANEKTAIKMWEDQLVPKNVLSTFKKLPKMEREDKGKWYINGIVIDEICPDTLDVYTRITSLKDRIIFAALFKTPDGFIGVDDSESEMGTRTSTFVRRHAVEVYKQAVQDELKALEKELKKKENEYSGYDKDNRKLDRKSQETKNTIKILKSSSVTSTNIFHEEQNKERHKEIKKEKKSLKRYSKKMDKNSHQQKKLTKEIKQKEEEIDAVEKKLGNIK